MKSIGAMFLFTCVVLSTLFGQASSASTKAKASTTADEQALKKIQHEWADALVKKDFAVIDRITAPDWVLTTPDGMLVTKAQADADIKSGAVKFDSFQTKELKVRVHGDTAVVHGLETEKSSVHGQDMSGTYRFTDTFAKIDGQWRCLATHVSKVMHAAE